MLSDSLRTCRLVVSNSSGDQIFCFFAITWFSCCTPSWHSFFTSNICCRSTVTTKLWLAMKVVSGFEQLTRNVDVFVAKFLKLIPALIDQVVKTLLGHPSLLKDSLELIQFSSILCNISQSNRLKQSLGAVWISTYRQPPQLWGWLACFEVCGSTFQWLDILADIFCGRLSFLGRLCAHLVYPLTLHFSSSAPTQCPAFFF